jgi:uncharacterized protein YjbK
MRETELKFAVAGTEAFARILGAFGGARSTVRQVNHYLVGDGEGVLARGEAMVRIREEAGKAYFTFKSGLVREGAYFSSREVECEIDAAQAASLLAGQASPLAVDNAVGRALRDALTPGPFRVAGRSTTDRTRVDLSNGECLEADHGRFPGGVEDFEIEVETEDPAGTERLLRETLAPLGVELVPQTRTKYRRFLDALARERGSTSDA